MRPEELADLALGLSKLAATRFTKELRRLPQAEAEALAAELVNRVGERPSVGPTLVNLAKSTNRITAPHRGPIANGPFPVPTGFGPHPAQDLISIRYHAKRDHLDPLDMRLPGSFLEDARANLNRRKAQAALPPVTSPVPPPVTPPVPPFDFHANPPPAAKAYFKPRNKALAAAAALALIPLTYGGYRLAKRLKEKRDEAKP